MSKVSIASVDKAPSIVLPGQMAGVESKALFGRESDPIHLFMHVLAPYATLKLAALATDRMVYVWEGEVEIGGHRLLAGSGAIVEFGAAVEMLALEQNARILVFGLREHAADGRAGHAVHVLPAAQVPRTVLSGAGMALFADAQSPTPRVWLHENAYAEAGVETKLHSHSEDEVMFVHAGSIRLGNRLCGPGTAIAIAADTKYAFFSGPDGLSFVNFRGASPTYTPVDGSAPMDEAKFWRSIVGQPEYLPAL